MVKVVADVVVVGAHIQVAWEACMDGSGCRVGGCGGGRE